MHIARKTVLVFLIGVLALAIRLPGLGSFMTADEENWMIRSGDFYHKLFRQADPGGTFQTTHPGATTMWIAGAGIVAQEARLGFDIDTSNLVHFRRAALLPMVIVISVLLAIASWQLIKLWGTWPGLLASVLLVLEPYAVGMSQIVHLDMLLALFMLNSVLAFLRAKKLPASLFAGLAMATKLLPSIWLFVFFGVYLLFSYRLKISAIVRRLGFLAGVAMLTFFVTWPALWTAADLGRSFERDVPSVIQDAHVAIEDSTEQIAPASFYVRSLLGRTSPFVLILTIGSLIAAIRFAVAAKKVSPALILMLYALGFSLLITLVAKKADRYLLPAFVTLPVVAGWGLSATLKIRNPKSEIRKVSSFVLRHSKFLFATIFLLLVGQIWLWIPHAIAYNNPFFPIRPLSQQGWGEGLEEAAAWLNEQPLASETYVASWYPSVFQNFYHGKTFSLSSRTDNRVSYVVLYRNMYGRGQDTIASDVLDEYRDKTPVHVVEIEGVPYVWVYATDSTELYKQHVGEIFGGTTVGQLVPVTQDNWGSIDIGMANFSNRKNTQDVILHVRESVEATTDLRKAFVNASEIQDGVFHRFEFEPIEGSSGKTFYVFIDSPTSQLGDAITIRFSNSDLLPGVMVKNSEVFTGRDIAYRLPPQ